MHNSDFSCRGCDASLDAPFLDLGRMPLANSYLRDTAAIKQETAYPLQVYVCPSCWLVQVPPLAAPEDIFSDYAYFSSFSNTWKTHCADYAAAMIDTLGLGKQHRVVEIASNDGCLLRCFQTRGIPVLGVEPAQNIAAQANREGIPTHAAFFGQQTAIMLRNEGIMADVLAANNVLAHVPDIHDFVSGFAVLLAPEGVITFEFPHLLELLRHTQFDTVYHEHFSYLSLTALLPLLEQHGLQAVDVEKLPTHGGSLRLFVRHAGRAQPSPRLAAVLEEETQAGLTDMATYAAFQSRVTGLRDDLLRHMQQWKAEGKRIAAYGAPAKGNTLLNYCGISTDLLEYTVDANPAKQGCLLPGSHLPIHAPDYLLQDKPDIVFILPWNIAGEIMRDMRAVKDWGGQFLIAVPEVRLA